MLGAVDAKVWIWFPQCVKNAGMYPHQCHKIKHKPLQFVSIKSGGESNDLNAYENRHILITLKSKTTDILAKVWRKETHTGERRQQNYKQSP